MRIMMLCDLYDPFVGGLERNVQTLSRELVARGHEVSVVTLWREGCPSQETDAYGVRVFRIGGWSRALERAFSDPNHHFHPPAPDPGTMRELASLVRRLSPDIVNTHSWILYSYLPLAHRFPARVVHTVHDYGFVCAKQNYLHRGTPCSGPAYLKCVRCSADQYHPAVAAAVTTGLAASSRLHSRIDSVVAISSAVAEASAVRARHPSRSVEVIPSFVPDGIVNEGLADSRPSFLPSEDGFLLFVGAVGTHKGVDVLLEAHRLMQTDVPLVLVGPHRAGAYPSLPDGVTLHAQASHPEVMASWRRASVGIVPSIWPEPFGQVAVEAMSVGTPVVASDIGGLRDIVAHDVTGLLVAPADPVALADAVRRLLADPAERVRLGAAGADHARQFMISAVVGRVEELFARVMNGIRAG
ncbi:MAG TPA: glycosyltransferase family 4 protein [Solirubrobacteraceae bacterium]|jgi:glycosyltransferase involved in cell wall biosynthesis|nr:glycosyltransferase family 4 protein [Solirubrobacteraceae bacterium]